MRGVVSVAVVVAVASVAEVAAEAAVGDEVVSTGVAGAVVVAAVVPLEGEFLSIRMRIPVLTFQCSGARTGGIVKPEGQKVTFD